MWHKKPKKLTVFQRFSLILTIGLTAFSSTNAIALTADEVLNKMNTDQRVGHITGIVTGLAYARWLIERPNETGRDCIHDWYHDGGIERHREIDIWFNRHLDKPVGALLYVLIKKECGELIGSTQ